MDSMFEGCISLKSLDIRNSSCEKIAKTSKLDDMFLGCDSLKIRNIKYNDFKIRSQAIIDLLCK